MKDSGDCQAIIWLISSSRNAVHCSMVAIAKRPLPGRMSYNRHDTVALVRNNFDLDRMEQAEGLQLLLVSLADSGQLAAAAQVLARLINLPLAIDQARGLQETSRVWQHRRTFPGMEEAKSLSLWATWEMSLRLLSVSEEHETKLQDVLMHIALFDPLSISGTIVEERVST